MWTRTTTRAAAATVLLAVTLAGCADRGDPAGADPPRGAASEPAAPDVPAGAEALLGEHGLAGLDVVAVIDRLDRLDRLGGDERPADLMASVRPGELVVSGGEEEFGIAIPEDRFYLSVAPYVDGTHDCFHHSLTTCRGELAATDVEVEIVDETHDEVLVDGTRTTFENGFTGFWLPRDIEGTLRITLGGRTGVVDFATDDEAPTCLTTLRLT